MTQGTIVLALPLPGVGSMTIAKRLRERGFYAQSYYELVLAELAVMLGVSKDFLLTHMHWAADGLSIMSAGLPADLRQDLKRQGADFFSPRTTQFYIENYRGPLRFSENRIKAMLQDAPSRDTQAQFFFDLHSAAADVRFFQDYAKGLGFKFVLADITRPGKGLGERRFRFQEGVHVPVTEGSPSEAVKRLIALT